MSRSVFVFVFLIGVLLSGTLFVIPQFYPSSNQGSPATLGAHQGPPTFSFGGMNSETVTLAPGSTQSSTFNMVVNNASLPTRMFLDDGFVRNNGTATFPNGASVFVSVDHQSFHLNPEATDTSVPNTLGFRYVGLFSNNNQLIDLPKGTNVVTYNVSLPQSVRPGSYRFWIQIETYSDNNAQFIVYSQALEVIVEVN